METIAGIIKYLPKYLVKILEVWIVWVWFVILDTLGLIVDTFVPTFSPPRWLYWTIAGAGFIVANAKLLLDYEERLEAYEYQAPEYEVQIVNVSTDICRTACHVNVYCDISIKAVTPWTGHLIKVTADGENPIQGLGLWEVHGTWYGDSCASPAHLPLELPDPILNLRIKIRSEISEPIDPPQSHIVLLPVNLVIGYFTQPVGDVQKIEALTVPVYLQEALQAILAYQEKPMMRPLESKSND